MVNQLRFRVQGDNWLPTVNNFGVHDPLKVEFQDIAVSTLIDPFSCTWDSNSLASALSPTEAYLVKRIPLSSGHAKDAQFQPYVQSGQYFAKFGYFFLKSESRCSPSIACNPPIHPKPPWKQIWSLSLLSKIKNFSWQACRNALPMKVNLVRQCVISDSTCSFYTNQCEDVMHALWTCPSLS